MEVLEGRILITIDGKEKTVSGGDPPVLIKRGEVHSIAFSKSFPSLLPLPLSPPLPTYLLLQSPPQLITRKK